MRQAGRYLPEYRKLREKFSSFMDFCFNPESVILATLQPIDRFDFDAAIIFSDILVIPHLLGQEVFFKEKIGPTLEKPDWQRILSAHLENKAEIIYDSITAVRKNLSPEKALIGFVGCPWTIASYMLSEGKTQDYPGLIHSLETWPLWDRVIEKLIEAVSEHAINQLRAGADVVQLFESWAAKVPPRYHQKWLFEPVEKIIQKIREKISDAPIIYYGRGVARHAITSLSHLKIGFGVSHEEELGVFESCGVCLQGNLDPQKLLDGNFELDVLNVLDFAKDKPFVVNLGHGILPQTPISHVERFVDLVRCQK